MNYKKEYYNQLIDNERKERWFSWAYVFVGIVSIFWVLSGKVDLFALIFIIGIPLGISKLVYIKKEIKRLEKLK